MKIYVCENNKLIEVNKEVLKQPSAFENIVWIDLFSPTEEERTIIGNFLSVKIPTLPEMQEIESSSRLYKEGEAFFMTVNAVKKQEAGNHKIVNITFVLKGNLLVTVRYEEIAPLAMFLKLVLNRPTFPIDNSVSLLIGILENIVEKIADTIEIISSTIEQLSEKIFVEGSGKNRDLSKILITMGLQGEINSKTRDSLSSIARTVGYLKFNINKVDEKHFESRLETLNLDTTDLKDHSAFLGHKINFILDASLGLINVEQNAIIKIFSIAAVVLLPPTLIASIYGMNFQFIPELQWKGGYPLALFLMVLSAILPYLYFKRKGWL